MRKDRESAKKEERKKKEHKDSALESETRL